MKLFNHYKAFLLLGFTFFSISTGYSDSDVLDLFPLEHYDQNITTWFKPTDPDFDKVLMSEEIQKKHLALFLDHYFYKYSPWNFEHINQIIQQPIPNDIKTEETNLIMHFSNNDKTDNQIGYGENFRPHSIEWVKSIAANMNNAQFENLNYQAHQRAIAIDNLHARILPTDDVHFYHYKIAGEGYPFDNLQMSAVWAGTPVYILGETQDHAWMLVVTPDFIAWVKSSGIARVNEEFIRTWTIAAKSKLAAISKTQTSLLDEQGKFLFTAYVGSVFPAYRTTSGIHMMVAVADADHNALIKDVAISSKNAVLMPFQATKHHFSEIISSMIGRPYGWGSMYFYNDCSAELKSLLTPFGIWLPRHSSEQVSIGNMVDLSSTSEDKRLDYLMKNGHQFLTIIYIGGHVVMYIGNYINPNNRSSLMPMTYQNLWGLRPHSGDKRSVIGGSVLFPILLQYPEDSNLNSLASGKYFQISYLDDLSQDNRLLKQNQINIKSMLKRD